MSVEAAEELRYSASHRGLQQAGDVDDLMEKGMLEQEGEHSYIVAVPPREARSKSNRHRDWSDEEILDRIRLWMLVTGKRPTNSDWSPTRLNNIISRQIAKVRTRVEAHQEVLRLYNEGDWPSTTVVIERFGSTNAAGVIAGFEPRSPGQQSSELRPTHKPESKTVAELSVEVEEAREEGGEPLRAALYQLAVGALTEADRMSAKAEKLKGPEFVAWLYDHGLRGVSQFGSNIERAINRWQNGKGASVAMADEVLTNLGYHLHDLPGSMWA